MSVNVGAECTFSSHVRWTRLRNACHKHICRRPNGTLCGAVGHDVRIGLEGTLVLGDGTRARDSAVLVPAAHAMAVAAAASSSRADASSGVRRAGMPH
jgi:uncharacterized protein (DUF849 family)